MDKVATNNHFVTLKKEAKKARAMVAGNLIRKIAKHKQNKEKVSDETHLKAIDMKIDNIIGDMKLLKTLDLYLIAKQATLKPDPEFWDKVISDNKATTESRLIARVIIKNNIQKQVAKFRADHVDCDEWLNEYIEYREKKQELLAAKSTKVVRRRDPSGTARHTP